MAVSLALRTYSDSFIVQRAHFQSLKGESSRIIVAIFHGLDDIPVVQQCWGIEQKTLILTDLGRIWHCQGHAFSNVYTPFISHLLDEFTQMSEFI